MVEQKYELNGFQKTNYGRFKLKFNPFPMTAVTAGGTPFPFYSPQAEKKVKSYIHRTYSENQYCGMLIIGDYGFGKTYTLRWIEKEINEKYSQRNSEASIAIYIENPLSSPRELISATISRYGINKYLTLLWKLVTQKFREKYIEKGQSFLSKFRGRQLGLYDKDLVLEIFHEAKIMDPMRLIRRLNDELSKIKQFNLEEFATFAYDEVISKIFGCNEFSHELSNFNPKGFSSSFRDWVALIEHKSIKRKVTSSIKDVDFMRSILHVLKCNGFKRVYLLIDEFEDIHENLRKEQLDSYLRTLRDCIDGNTDMLALVIALKPRVAKKIENIYPAFSHRFPISHRIDLPGIMKESIKLFVKEILKSAREEGYEKMGIIPFTTGGLERIYQLTGPNPRLLLQTCSDLLFEVAQNDNESIDEEFIEKYYVIAHPSDASAMDEVWLSKKVCNKIDEELKGEGK